MITRLRTRRFLRAALQLLPIIVLIMGGTTSGQAQTPSSDSAVGHTGTKPQKGNSVLEVPPVIGNVAVSSNGLAFHPYIPGTEYSYVGVGISNTAINERAFETTINLPNGARINQIVFAFYDNNPSADLRFTLGFGELSSPYGTSMASVNSAGTSDVIQYIAVTDITPNIIDNQNNNYFVEVVLPPGLTTYFVGFRIDYSYNVFTPMINK